MINQLAIVRDGNSIKTRNLQRHSEVFVGSIVQLAIIRVVRSNKSFLFVLKLILNLYEFYIFEHIMLLVLSI
jgi:hypothetical protein